MSFSIDKEISKAAEPYIDEIYRSIWPECKITRFPKEDDRHILDKLYHIDVEIELKNGIKILGQEKALRKRWANLDTFTIEFYQNCETKEKGEFFNLGAQFYFHGYVNGNIPKEITGFLKWNIIKIFDFFMWIKNTPIEKIEAYTSPLNSEFENASFFWRHYDKMPKGCFYKRSIDEKK